MSLICTIAFNATPMQLQLNGRTALISGSSQGIGFAAAYELASLGANCVLLARDAARLADACSRLPKNEQQQHQFEVADFSKPDEVLAVIQRITSKHTIHIVVNNTGGPAAGPAHMADPSAFLAAFQQHLICNHHIVQACWPQMRDAGYGRIINIISTSVKVPLPNLGVSNTIRGAVASWAKTLANELGVHGITVNNVLPGATSTGRLDAIIQNNAAKTSQSVEEVATHMQQEIPMRRFGKPEEIAAVVAFLASPAAAYVTGTSIPVDGGRTGSI